MIKIDLLQNHPDAIPELANIWYEVLGKMWSPEVPVERVITKLAEHLNDRALPITFVAFDGERAVGMSSLRENDGIRHKLTPWFGSLVVAPEYQKQGIGKMLVDVALLKAKELGFEKLYLFAFDPTIPDYYSRLGWHKIGMDEFKSSPVTVMEIDV
ncbi:GNAT family N-acetyltransferase [Aeromonas rivipollensis]|uniref:GNAT family N-acetyltransferase n=1 Tax=Aeromonas rivipollensis TaxID=948519 RepID=UPI00259ED916|nr:GNAT family N-acetyltransferase [Aeromonas rivipollensis]MDM5057265.1 GNAT family N-acetyltransferase [Aeromonas rivipollensis]